MEKETQEKIQQLQLIEQSLQSLLQQKQQFQQQLSEIDSAASEVEQSESCYKIVGAVMVDKKKDDLVKELKDKKEVLELRITSLNKQEETVRKKAKTIQEEVMKVMEADKK